MYIGTIRPIETATVTAVGAGLEEVAVLVSAQAPEGWDVVETKVAMSKHETTLSATATIARRDGVQEIQGVDYATVVAAVPDGFQLLHVRQEA
ncbi:MULTISPECIES: hypothetical protein [unclassified Leucobacter]|uniref:hypothetical protein n=1 Tax=unclassified Leucobacter TaxID=2621730 RepID=UPI00301693C7